MANRAPHATGDTRDAIAAVALGLFAEHGFASVSIRDISDIMGLAPSAIYHHYRGKQDLYDRVVQTAFERVSDTLGSQTDIGGAPEAALRELLRRYTAYIFADPAELRLVDRVVFEQRKGGLDFGSPVNRPKMRLAGLITEIDTSARADDLAEHMIAAIYGAAKLRPVRAGLGENGRFGDPAIVAESLADMLIKSLDLVHADGSRSEL